MNAVMRLAFGWGAVILAAGWPGPGVAGTPPTDTAGPSFSCSAAHTPAEKAICGDPSLAAADREVAALFALGRQSAFGTGPSNELAAQRKFLKDMRSCGEANARSPIPKCLAALYDQRNGELAIAALMRAPDQALPVLRRLDAGFAPVLEAAALWAAEPVDADWSAPARAATRKRIAALLTPYLTELRTNESQSFGWSILSEPGGDWPVVKRIDDIFLSERHFAALLHVLGPYLLENTGTGAVERALPCAAIVRHPALLEATGSVFGSTMDNFVLRSDCARTLPAVPALEALDRKILGTWPQCDGTIRFAAYRSYQTAVDAARLGQSDRAAGDDATAPQDVPMAAITPARTELERYYAAYLGKSPAQASALARITMGAVLSAAHGCGT